MLGPASSGAGEDGATSEDACLLLPRLSTAPESGQLVAMESRARIFPPLLHRRVTLRDDRRRTAVHTPPPPIGQNGQHEHSA